MGIETNNHTSHMLSPQDFTAYKIVYSGVGEKKTENAWTWLKRLVGAPGFEPGASCAQGRRAI
jgi:hypothetical protein